MLNHLKKLLSIPDIYTKAQTYLGFADSRRKALHKWLEIPPDAKVLDIGCGPGHITQFLPENITYCGFDIDDKYIEQAKQDYGHRGEFHCRIFDDSCLNEYHDMDVILLNGVLHHMTNDQAIQCLNTCYKALKTGGKIFTLDGCYISKQNIVAKKLLDWDRGQFVRDEQGYKELISIAFSSFNIYISEDLSLIPYTFIIMIGEKA
jgi:SAM-dependent methyltransferase